MPKSRRSKLAVALLYAAGFIAATAAQAQTHAPGPAAPGNAAKEEYSPSVGQAGKDVVWVPSPVETVQLMLDIAKLAPSDFVVDLGSGDGRNVILAAKRGARGLGVEFNPDLVELSKRNAAREGVEHLAQFVQGDMFETDFSKATVLALFLLPDNLRRLEPKFLKLAPGTRIVANTFGIDGWTPERVETITGDCSAWCRVLLYTVPAAVGGVWRTGAERFELTQKAQTLGGVRTRNRESRPIEGKIEGERVLFTIGPSTYSGVAKGDRIEGTVEAKGRTRRWIVRRVS